MDALGLRSGDTWEAMFALPAVAGSTINVELRGNTATIKWRPKIIVYKCAGFLRKQKLPVTDASYSDCVSRILAGALQWTSAAAPNPNPLRIRGVEGKVIVEIYDKANRLYIPGGTGYQFDAENYFDSNIAVYIGRPDRAIVIDAFRWRGNKKLRVTIASPHDRVSTVGRVMEHEFGHVLGLFDAYGYAKKCDPANGCYHYGGHPCPDRLFPPAFIDGDRIKRNSVMVCDYAATDGTGWPQARFIRTELDYEMVLLAWRDNRLQLYTDSILGKRSRAGR